MKNYLFLGLMGTAVFFNSCSSSDESINETGKPLLLSKVTTFYYDNPSKPETTVATFGYNNQGQLIKIQSKEGASVFEYSNGKPVKENHYNAQQQLDYYAVFNYKADQLTGIQYIHTDATSDRTITYAYNSGGKMISSSLCESADCLHPITFSLAYTGDNVSVETNTFDGKTFYKRELSYDNHLSPYANINNHLKIMMGGAYYISMSNSTAEKISYTNENGGWNQGQNITYSIQYNSSQLPIQVIGKEANGNNYVQYNYEYITQ